MHDCLIGLQVRLRTREEIRRAHTLARTSIGNAVRPSYRLNGFDLAALCPEPECVLCSSAACKTESVRLIAVMPGLPWHYQWPRGGATDLQPGDVHWNLLHQEWFCRRTVNPLPFAHYQRQYSLGCKGCPAWCAASAIRSIRFQVQRWTSSCRSSMTNCTAWPTGIWLTSGLVIPSFIFVHMTFS